MRCHTCNICPETDGVSVTFIADPEIPNTFYCSRCWDAMHHNPIMDGLEVFEDLEYDETLHDL